jgi:hypothetical protein
MDLQSCYNASEDTFPLPLNIKQLYGPFGFPTRTPRLLYRRIRHFEVDFAPKSRPVTRRLPTSP